MSSVVVFELLMAILFVVLGCWIYLSAMGDYELLLEDGEDVEPPSRETKLIVCGIVAAYCTFSTILLFSIGGKIISAIIALLSGLICVGLAFAIFTAEDSYQKTAAFGCLLPVYMEFYTASVGILTPRSGSGFSIVSIVFLAVIFGLWLIVKVKKGFEYEED